MNNTKESKMKIKIDPNSVSKKKLSQIIELAKQDGIEVCLIPNFKPTGIIGKPQPMPKFQEKVSYK
jgi:hypothetical protein